MGGIQAVGTVAQSAVLGCRTEMCRSTVPMRSAGAPSRWLVGRGPWAVGRHGAVPVLTCQLSQLGAAQPRLGLLQVPEA